MHMQSICIIINWPKIMLARHACIYLYRETKIQRKISVCATESMGKRCFQFKLKAKADFRQKQLWLLRHTVCWLLLFRRKYLSARQRPCCCYMLCILLAISNMSCASTYLSATTIESLSSIIYQVNPCPLHIFKPMKSYYSLLEKPSFVGCPKSTIAPVH